MKFCHKLFSFLPHLPLLLALCLLGIPHASASQKAPEIANAKLISATDAIGESREVTFGVYITMKEGWKTYWRSPGDAGIAPKFSWEGSSNIEDIEVHWPAPMSFDSFGFLTWGYENEVVFPVTAKIKDQASDLQVNLKFDYGVCAKVCIPISENISLLLPAGEKKETLYGPLLTHFQDRVPKQISDNTHVHSIDVRSHSEEVLQVALMGSNALLNPQIILEGEEGDYFEIGQPVLSDDSNQAVFEIKADFLNKKRSVIGREIITTIIDQNRAVEAKIRIQ